MKILRIDFESRGVVELGGQKSVGLWNYMTHPLTSLLMLAYKLPDSNVVKLWRIAQGEPMPDELRAALLDPEVMISAFNCAFERYALWHKLGIIIPATRFIDPQVGARYLAMPGDLDSACHILSLPFHLRKDKRGEELIDLFSKPKKRSKKEGGGQYFNDWNTHPKEWEEFCEYCRQDVIAEEEVYRRIEILQALPMPPFERRLWEFDQVVNDRGMPVDIDFVTKALGLAERAKQEALDSQNALTGLENANSTTQLLPWARQRGYPYNTLNKAFVEAAIKDPECKMDELCIKVLKARRVAASTSYTKLSAILRQVCADGRLRNQFIYLGSSRCGRWAGGGVQLHNLARPETLGKSDANPDGYDFEDIDVINEARALVYGEKYDEIKARYGGVLAVIKNLIRTAFVAPEIS